MIFCDHCNKVVCRQDYCVDADQRDLHSMCLKHLQTVQIIRDYVAICEKRNELLNFSEFVPLWMAANAIAVETLLDGSGGEPGEPPSPSSPRPRP